jgi:hypothetical protein
MDNEELEYSPENKKVAVPLLNSDNQQNIASKFQRIAAYHQLSALNNF